MVTGETITDAQILQVRDALDASHLARQCTIDALTPSASHPNRRHIARNECAWLFNKFFGGR